MKKDFEDSFKDNIDDMDLAVPEEEEHEEINVVYTGENESADQYIERLAREIGKNYRVCAVSSDNMIQVAALRTGVTRMSSRELELETEKTREDIAGVIRAHRPKRVTIGDTGLL